jgi:hypothetical protein
LGMGITRKWTWDLELGTLEVSGVAIR